MQRTSTACVRCRKCKIKCNIEKLGPGTFSRCDKCQRAGVDCTPATSNRGGARRARETSKPSQLRTEHAPDSLAQDRARPAQPPRSQAEQPASQFSHHGPLDDHAAQRSSPNGDRSEIDIAIESTSLHTTSNALNILGRAAERSTQNGIEEHNATSQAWPGIADETAGNNRSCDSLLVDYHPVRSGSLTASQVARLVERFAEVYDLYYPIVPRKVLQQDNLSETAKNEPCLLTAIITIAAQDVGGANDCILRSCVEHMQSLVNEMMVGRHCKVGAVEALLLLAEWEPQFALAELSSSTCGVDDVAAYMHIGLALRIASFLRLENRSLEEMSVQNQEHAARERLAWTACVLSDSQISIRTGRPFASRGSGPAALTRTLPSTRLCANSSEGDDHVKIFQARLELTQIFSNVHGILYCGLGNRTQTRVTNSHLNYLDDFQTAICAWKAVWGTLTCSLNVKILLDLSYEYLRLYTHAFVFQAKNLSPPASGYSSDHEEGIEKSAGPGFSQETKHVYEAVDAARSLLTIVNNYVSADAFKHFPLRFLLYCTNATVFLYKALSLKKIFEAERRSIGRLAASTIKRLRQNSVRSGDLSAKYAHLLELLWNGKRDGRISRNDTSNTTEAPPPEIPSNTGESQYEEGTFSWLDLESMGEFLFKDLSDAPILPPSEPMRESQAEWIDFDNPRPIELPQML